jgi:hypothetical protein
MTDIDFSSLQRKRKPTKKEAKVYRAWVKYLSDSRLEDWEIHRRAKYFTEQGHKP